MARKGNGEGSVWKTGETFKAALWIDGQRVVRRAKTEKEAYAKLDELLAQRDYGTSYDVGREKLSSYLTDWINHTAKRTLRPHSWDMYRSRMAIVSAAIGGITLNAVNARHIDHLYAGLEDQGYQPATIQQLHVILKNAFHSAVKRGYIAKNPCDDVETPRNVQREQNVLTSAQLFRVIGEIDGDRWRTLWLFLGTTGLRIGEALALTWADIDGDEVRVRRSVGHVPGKGLVAGELKTPSARRSVPLPEITRRALRAYALQQKETRLSTLGWTDHNLVFPNSKGDYLRVTVVRHALNTHLQEAGLPIVRIHDLRHTAATVMLHDLHYPMLAVQEILGHSQISMTLGTYGHVERGMLKDLAGRWDELATKETS